VVQLREFIRDRQGSTIIMVAVSLFMVLAVASLSIDAIYLYVLKDRLQMTADIAALAAVQDIEDEDQAKATAIEFATKNMETNDHGHVLSLVDVVVGRWDLDARSFAPGSIPANAVRVTTRRDEVNANPAGLFFARVLGVNEAELIAQATAAFEPRKIELAMILDTQDRTGDDSRQLWVHGHVRRLHAVPYRRRQSAIGHDVPGRLHLGRVAHFHRALPCLGPSRYRV
jgi:hypothetical protein